MSLEKIFVVTLHHMIKQGIVYCSTGSQYKVKSEERFYTCGIKGKFRIKGIKSTNPVAVGDRVSFALEKEGEDIGVINGIGPRSNYIVRKSVNLSKQIHIIASNIDQAFLMITLKTPPTHRAFIDRFLVTARAYQIEAILVFNKIDIYTKEELTSLHKMRKVYENIGYKCVEVVAKDKFSLKEIQGLMQGKVSVFSGHSGVGKSTLVNTLSPGLSLKTAAVSPHHQQGQHTTTFAEMYDMENDAKIIDTPGIKGFGVVDMAPIELAGYFPEFLYLKEKCKFNNCLHINEPDCAIKAALETGSIAESRYKSYLQLLEDDTPYR